MVLLPQQIQDAGIRHPVLGGGGDDFSQVHSLLLITMCHNRIHYGRLRSGVRGPDEPA